MSLEPGTLLGPYKITAAVGAGGMGEVYQAVDTRLDRTVAIKVLPERLSADPQLKQRFEREARSVSSLNHPHICTLHDVGHQDGIDFLVMEYLEGTTLSQRLEEGPLPAPELLRYATQIADAMDKAHRSGVLHRDLKPANIMLTATGAKVLDFGLAKTIGTSAEDSGLTAAATATSPLTTAGSVIGTFQYMAPELLEGGEADARSDIFAFGMVMYEMASGKSPFEGKTQAGLIASILKEEPRPLSAMAPMAPPALSRLVETCLAKDPETRRQTMHDVLLDLQWIAEAGSQAGVPAPVAARRKSRAWTAWGVAAAAALAAAVFAGLWLAAPSVPTRMVQSSLLPPEGTSFDAQQGVAVSPDGSQLAFVARQEDGVSTLWVRDIDSLLARNLTGTDGAYYPFWSPGGTTLGFFAPGKLKRVDAAGGPVQTLADADSGRGGTWGPDGTIVFCPTFNGGLARMPAMGGNVEKLTQLDQERSEGSHRYPFFLPDGRHVIFLSQTAEGGTQGDESRIEVVSLDGERTPLFTANSSVHYSSTGHILFWREGSIFAQPFDASSLTVAGGSLPIAEGIIYTPNELANFSISTEGTLVYQGGEGVGSFTQLAWFDREGNRLEEVSDPAFISSPALSHDETRVAFEEEGDLWVFDLARATKTRLTFDPAFETDPVWSPDDRYIYYSSNKVGEPLFRKLASGLGKEEVVATPLEYGRVTDISPDGTALLLTDLDSSTQRDLWLLPLDGEPEPLIQTPFWEAQQRYSPDGEWTAYASSESGRLEVYVQRLTGPGGRWQISSQGGIHPIWSRDGKEIFYFGLLTQELKAVSVDLSDTFRAGVPETLFEVTRRPGNRPPYDVSADGSRFLINVLLGAESREPLTLVQNWTELLERR